jgi:hypothetical protein
MYVLYMSLGAPAQRTKYIAEFAAPSLMAVVATSLGAPQGAKTLNPLGMI